jgi:hypothetical protein
MPSGLSQFQSLAPAGAVKEPSPDSRLCRFAYRARTGILQLLRQYGLLSSEIVTPSGQLDYYEWYWAYGEILRPRNVLEIGVLGGGSMVALCAGADQHVRRVTLIDDESDKRSLSQAADRIRKAAGPNCEVVQSKQDSQRLHRIDTNVMYDVISIDGDHRVGPCFHDLRLTLPALAPNGHIICDDGNWPWVVQAVSDMMHLRSDLNALHVNTFTGSIVLHKCGNACPLLEEPDE